MAALPPATISLTEAGERKIGTVTAVSIPAEFQFQINQDAEKPLLQDFVVTEHPTRPEAPVFAKIIRMSRFNPLLPEEATMELARLSIDTSLTPLPIGKMEMAAAACQVLGYVDTSGRLRNPSYPVKPGSSVYAPSKEFIEKALGTIDIGKRVVMGALRNRPDVSIAVDGNEILNKHLAILAMTGSGKTYTAAVVLEALMKKGYPLLILDPHGDYLNLGVQAQTSKPFGFKLEDKEKGTYKLSVFDRSVSIMDLQKDDFLDFVQGMLEEDITPPQRSIWAAAYDYAKKVGRSGMAALYAYLNKISKETEEGGKRGGGASIGVVFRQLNEIRRLISNVDTTLTLREIERALGPGKGVVLNMSLFPYQVQRVNVSVILQSLFEKRKKYVIQNKKEDVVPPMFVVVEEAHNFAPAEVEGENYPSRAILRRIATEGRKFGFGLCVISQRPSRVDSTVLSQCNSQAILKIINPNDQAYIRQTVETLAQSDLMSLPDLSQGEALLSGAMIRVPTVVRIPARTSKEGIAAKDRFEEIASLSEIL